MKHQFNSDSRVSDQYSAPTPDEACCEQICSWPCPGADLLPDVEDIAAGDIAGAGNAVGQADRLVPHGHSVGRKVAVPLMAASAAPQQNDHAKALARHRREGQSVWR